MKLNKIFKIFAITALSLVLIQCTAQRSERNKQFSDQDFEDRSKHEQLSPAMQSERQKYQDLLMQTESAFTHHLATAGDAYDINFLVQKVIIPLKNDVLSFENLSHPQLRYLLSYKGREMFPRLISIFNQALLLVYKQSPKTIQNMNILNNYKSLMFWDCDQNLAGSCDILKYFRSADRVNASKVIKIFHDLETDENEKLRMVKAAFDLKNSQMDESLRFMLLERIAKSLKLENAKRIDSRRLNQDADLFANILKLTKNSKNGKFSYGNFVKELNPWSLSRNVDNPLNPSMTDLLKIASKTSIYGQNGKDPSPTMISAIQKLKYVVGSNYEQGVKFQLKNIRGEWKKVFIPEFGETELSSQAMVAKQALSESLKEDGTDINELKKTIDTSVEADLFGKESEKIIKNLLGNVSFKYDEYFFLVHQIYYGHYNIDDAASFWKSTTKNRSRLMEAIDNLIKIQVVNNIVLTNNKMNKFYNKNSNTKIIQLLVESEKEASKIRKAWSGVLERSKSLKSFANRVILGSVSPTSSIAKEAAILSQKIESLTKNIKYLVTYPNMFPLLHLMAALEANDTIRLYFGSITIDNKTVIKTFFNGTFIPWFNFGNDDTPLDRIEITHSFYYALSTEIFKTYSTNHLVDFSIEDFFRTVVKQLIIESQNDIEKKALEIRKSSQQFLNSMNSMKSICDEEKKLQSADLKTLEGLQSSLGDQFQWQEIFYQNMSVRKNIKTNIPFSDIVSKIYDPNNKDDGKIGAYMASIYKSDYARLVQSMNVDFKSQIAKAQSLMKVYVSYGDGSSQEIQKIYDEQILEFEKVKTSYLKEIFLAHKKINNCDVVFAKRDRDLRHAIMLMEYKFLENLFEDIYTVLSSFSAEERSNPSEETLSQIEEIRKKHYTYAKSNFYPEEYASTSGYTKISPTSVTTYPMDIRSRIKSYMDVNFEGQYEISKPLNYDNEDYYKKANSGEIFINWHVADKDKMKRKFIESGMKVFSEMVQFTKTPTPTSIMGSKGDMLRTLFQLGQISLDSSVDCKKPENQSNENCVRVTARELIDHHKETIDFINISDRDLFLMDLVGSEVKYQEQEYQYYIKYFREHKVYAYYDLIFKKIFSSDSVTSPETLWFSGELQKYVQSIQKLKSSTFLFPFPDSIEKGFKDIYAQWIHHRFDLIEEFLLEVEKDKKAEVSVDVDIRYQAGKVFNLQRSGSNSLSPYISDLMYQKYQGMVTQLNRDTSSKFFPLINERQKRIEKIGQ